MKLRQKIETGVALAKVRFGKGKIPVVVTWAIAGGCNKQCLYCEEWKKREEITTEQAFRIVDELKNLGTKRISLSGGEPLAREDIGEIIDRAKMGGIGVVVTSNGSLVAKRIKELKNLDLLKLSIEGRKEVHDKLRGKGSFDEVMEAIRAAQKLGIKIVFNAVLTKYTLGEIDFLIDLAKKYETGVRFTVISEVHGGKRHVNPLLPAREEYISAIEKIIEAKRSGKPSFAAKLRTGRPVLNSLAGLAYYKEWPDPRKLACFAGKGFCHIDARGDLFPCVMMAGRGKGVSVLKDGVGWALDRLGETACQGCWCGGTLELNLALGVRGVEVLRNVKRLV